MPCDHPDFHFLFIKGSQDGPNFRFASIEWYWDHQTISAIIPFSRKDQNLTGFVFPENNVADTPPGIFHEEKTRHGIIPDRGLIHVADFFGTDSHKFKK